MPRKAEWVREAASTSRPMRLFLITGSTSPHCGILYLSDSFGFPINSSSPLQKAHLRLFALGSEDTPALLVTMCNITSWCAQL